MELTLIKILVYVKILQMARFMTICFKGQKIYFSLIYKEVR